MSAAKVTPAEAPREKPAGTLFIRPTATGHSLQDALGKVLAEHADADELRTWVRKNREDHQVRYENAPPPASPTPAPTTKPKPAKRRKSR